MTYAEYEAQRAQIIAQHNVSMRRYEEVSQGLFAKAESLLRQFNESIRDHHIDTSLRDQYQQAFAEWDTYHTSELNRILLEFDHQWSALRGRWVGSSMIAMHVGDQEGGAS